VWGDQWILGASARKVKTPVLAGNPNMKVSELIDPHTGWWKVGMIQEIFISEDAQAICNLALSPFRNPDKLVWQGIANDCFLVRSAYHQEMVVRTRDRGESSTATRSMRSGIIFGSSLLPVWSAILSGSYARIFSPPRISSSAGT
jgi:hypothetical protein